MDLPLIPFEKNTTMTKILKISTLVYLLIPTFIFLLTWLTPAYGISSCVLIGYFSFQCIKTIIQTDNGVVSPKLSGLSIGLSIGIALALNLLVGIGEFRTQTLDFMSNNLKIRDLITKPWPLYYPVFKVYMCYYLGYYLPIASVGKLIGLAYCRYIALVWSTLGTSLLFLWLSTFLSKGRIVAILTLLFFSNAWCFYKIIYWLDFQPYINPPFHLILHKYWLMRPPFWDGFAWAPQHILPACLGACFILQANVSKKIHLQELLLMLLATLYWSPLASIGLFPFVLYFFLREWRYTFSPAVLFTSLGTILGFVPLLLYFVSTQGVNNGNTFFIWEAGVSAWFWCYLFYIGFNVLLWYFLLSRFQHPFKHLLWIASILLTLLPLYQIGEANDLNVRAAVPALMIFIIIIAFILTNYRQEKNVYYWIILLLLAINSLPTWSQIYRSCLPAKPKTSIERADWKNLHDTFSFQAVMYKDSSATLEYSLQQGSVFEQHFLKK